MRSANPLKVLQALIVGCLSLFAFGHIALTSEGMTNMEGMGHEMTSSVQCQVLCSSAIKSEEVRFIGIEQKDEDPLPPVTVGLATAAGLFAIGFIVKRLHLLSSWRPPDLVLLSGRYSDGL